METTREVQADGWVELRVRGRLDNYWAEHFKSVLEEMVQSGTHKVRLDLAEVNYLSSAGAGALVWCHKHLDGVRGKLVVANPSDPVKEVLEVTRLATLLTMAAAPPRGHPATTVALGRRVERGAMAFEFFAPAGASGVSCRLIGDPGRLQAGGFGANDCRPVRFPATALGVGLGAPGESFADCQGRFGEFLAAAGAAAYLPTDGSNVPDYLVTATDALPDWQVCYGLLCDGALGHFSRFEAATTLGRVSLSRLAQGLLGVAEADRIAVVLLVETAGLIGAALRAAPVAGALTGSPFAFPQVRDWLTFTGERAHMRSTALVVGVVARGDPGPLAPLLRPLGKDPQIQGHCHAAPFSYRPLPRGAIELRPAVATLFEQQTLQGILHLLADHREAVGLGESEFIRGACWFAPIREVVPNGDGR